MSFWCIRDEEGDDWEITPIIRFVRKDRRLFLQQKYVKVLRVQTIEKREREERWMEVPTIDGEIRLLTKENEDEK